MEMSKRRAYIAGGGLAGIATAFYLIDEGGIPGTNITVFEASDFAGGSLDAFYRRESNSYFMRGFRMLEDKVYSALFDLMSRVPSLEDPQKSLMDEYVAFNWKVRTHSKTRLIAKGRPVNARPFRMSFVDRLKLLWILTLPEKRTQGLKIEDIFSAPFFKSNFWLEFGTTFSFQPWHSLEELKRYILRFLHDAPVLDTHTCIRSTKYNQYESVVLPVKTWLKANGVDFQHGTTVTDAKFTSDGGKMRIHEMIAVNGGEARNYRLEKGDLAFLTLGSMTAGHTIGSMNTSPAKHVSREISEWTLWNNISQVNSEFGRVEVFTGRIDRTGWVSFTVTCSDPVFFNLIEKLTGRKTGTEGPITITDSNWLISFALPSQPHFMNQPESLSVFWGYGMYPNAEGNFVKKRMSECSGSEILIELLSHLRFECELDAIIASADCIPCMMPYITSQFMPRQPGDRPRVVPACSENFAFTGQFCEIPEDIVFTLEYSVRSAQIAVLSLLGMDTQPVPIYRGRHSLKNVFNAVRTALR